MQQSHIFSKLARRLSAALLGCSVAVGCSGGSDVELSNLAGKVTFAGKPVVYGTMEIVPDTAANHKGPAGSAEIHDGLYDTRTNGRGIVPGAHIVRFTVHEQLPGPASEDETKPSTAKPPIVYGFPVKVEIKGGPQDFEIPENAKGYNMLKAAAPPRRTNEP